MLALTLHKPWPWAVMHLPPAIAKDIENRDWPLPVGLIGERIALHAGKTFDHMGAAWIEKTFGVTVPPEQQHPYGVVGTVKLTGCVTQSPSRWFVGKYGFALADRVVFDKPIAIGGGQKFWNWEPPAIEPVKRWQSLVPVIFAEHNVMMKRTERKERLETALENVKRSFDPQKHPRPLENFLNEFELIDSYTQKLIVYTVSLEVWAKCRGEPLWVLFDKVVQEVVAHSGFVLEAA